MLWERFFVILILNYSGHGTTFAKNYNDLVSEMDCECGIKNPGFKHQKEGSDYSGEHVWPWMVSIVNVTGEPEAYCGATLINDRYILTAAHCIPDLNETGVDNFRIYLGTNLIADDSSFLDLGIFKIQIHPKFDFETADYDVSLIKLENPVQFTKWIRPICLKQNGAPHVGRQAVMTGWGSFNITEPTDTLLKEADASVVSNELCSKNYSTVDIPITGTMLCASINQGHDPCKGDSGGPLVIRDISSKNKYSQIGIISHGQGCSVPDFPSIFSRVEMFRDWIVENTKDALYCTGSF